MTDLITRLRENADLDAAEHVPEEVVAMQYEAADTIEQQAERIKELEFSWAGCSQQLKDACSDLDAVEQHRDELAAQNQVLREALEYYATHTSPNFCCPTPTLAHDALALPDHSAHVLDMVRAKTLEEAAAVCDDWKRDHCIPRCCDQAQHDALNAASTIIKSMAQELRGK